MCICYMQIILLFFFYFAYYDAPITVKDAHVFADIFFLIA